MRNLKTKSDFDEIVRDLVAIEKMMTDQARAILRKRRIIKKQLVKEVDRAIVDRIWTELSEIYEASETINSELRTIRSEIELLKVR